MGLTIETLRASMAKLGAIPPMPFLASSKLLPSENALSFQYKGRQHYGAGPLFWSQIARRFGTTPELMTTHTPSFTGVPIIDIDRDLERRKEFFEALVVIMESGAGPIEDAIATAIERGYRAKPGQVVKTGPMA